MYAFPASLDVVGLSDTGRVREHNEDALWMGDHFFRTGSRSRRFSADELVGRLLAVADGVGGAAAGEVASEWVSNQMAERVAAGLAEAADRDLAEILTRIGRDVNGELIEEGSRQPGRTGMATTYTALLFRRDRTLWMNAGDSRLYLFGDGELRQVSRDHTLREETGDPSIPGNIITNCFGTRNEFRLDVGGLDLAGASLAMLCSDGLSDYADMSRVAAVLADLERAGAAPDDEEKALAALEDAAAQLLRLALVGGGGDNVSFMIARPNYA